MEQQLKLIIGSDIAGYNFKCHIIKEMEAQGYKLTDAGCNSSGKGLYAPIGKKVADAVAAKEADYGILICGTGQGMAMAANKVTGIKAALCYDILPAVLSKEHNHSNILCTGAWMMTVPKALQVIEAWLLAQYAGNNDEGLGLLERYELEGGR